MVRFEVGHFRCGWGEGRRDSDVAPFMLRLGGAPGKVEW